MSGSKGGINCRWCDEEATYKVTSYQWEKPLYLCTHHATFKMPDIGISIQGLIDEKNTAI